MMRHGRDWTIGELGVAGKANGYLTSTAVPRLEVVVQIHHVCPFILPSDDMPSRLSSVSLLSCLLVTHAAIAHHITSLPRPTPFCTGLHQCSNQFQSKLHHGITAQEPRRSSPPRPPSIHPSHFPQRGTGTDRHLPSPIGYSRSRIAFYSWHPGGFRQYQCQCQCVPAATTKPFSLHYGHLSFHSHSNPSHTLLTLSCARLRASTGQRSGG